MVVTFAGLHSIKRIWVHGGFLRVEGKKRYTIYLMNAISYSTNSHCELSIISAKSITRDIAELDDDLSTFWWTWTCGSLDLGHSVTARG